jgi:hypothetical protein
VPKLVPHGGPVRALKTASLLLLAFLAPLIVGCGDDETPLPDITDHAGGPVVPFTDIARLAPYSTIIYCPSGLVSGSSAEYYRSVSMQWVRRSASLCGNKVTPVARPSHRPVSPA